MPAGARSLHLSLVTAGSGAEVASGTAVMAEAGAEGSLTVQGFGFGHGRGMGQWGAFGYATAYHWSYQRILAHYYGGTVLGRLAQPNVDVPVLLEELTGKPLQAVALPGQNLVASWPGGGIVSAHALEVVWRSGTAHIYSGLGCAGPWQPVASVPASAATTTLPGTEGSGGAATTTVAVPGGEAAGVTVSVKPGLVGPAATTTGAGVQATPAFDLCFPRTGSREYAGQAISRPDATVMNIVPLEPYVEGVVPAESPESWAALGGEAALEAQAVAARSYAVASVAAYGYVCDDTRCQMYTGVPDQYGPTADAAVSATSGEVLYCTAGSACGPAGSVALAEYSASTGGYSAGGAFPAVPDLGDYVSSNPVHSWTVTIAASRLKKAFPSLGSVTNVEVTQRNGLGALGGRALYVAVAGPDGHLVVTGSRFEALLGLPSDWFQVEGQPEVPAATTTSPPAAPTTSSPAPASVTTTTGTTTTTGAATTTRAGSTATGRGATTKTGPDVPSGAQVTGASYWVVSTQGELSAAGRAPYLGTAVGTTLQGSVSGIAASGRAKGYWLAGTHGGVLAFGRARWYGSASDQHLRAPVVAIAPTPDGRGYWLASRDGGVFNYGDARFFGSIGASGTRHPVVGMAATPDGQGYWLVTSNGGVFPFGEAGFYGSTAGMHLARPIAGIVAAPGGRGYFLIGRDGGVFAYGDAHYAGSLPSSKIRADVVSVAQAPHGGYYMLSSAGTVYEFSRNFAGVVGASGAAASPGNSLVAMAAYRG